MNEKDIAHFRTIIMSRLSEIADEDGLGAHGQKVVTLDQQSVGRLSRMDALQNQAMANATQARRDGEASALTIALKRLEEDEFGYCMDCGDDIAKERLEFNPATLKCISCAKGLWPPLDHNI